MFVTSFLFSARFLLFPFVANQGRGVKKLKWNFMVTNANSRIFIFASSAWNLREAKRKETQRRELEFQTYRAIWLHQRKCKVFGSCKRVVLHFRFASASARTVDVFQRETCRFLRSSSASVASRYSVQRHFHAEFLTFCRSVLPRLKLGRMEVGKWIPRGGEVSTLHKATWLFLSFWTRNKERKKERKKSCWRWTAS